MKRREDGYCFAWLDRIREAEEKAFNACKKIITDHKIHYSLDNDYYEYLDRFTVKTIEEKIRLIEDCIAISLDACLSLAKDYFRAAKVYHAAYYTERINCGDIGQDEREEEKKVLTSPETVFYFYGDSDGFLDFITKEYVHESIESETITKKDENYLNIEILSYAIGICWFAEANEKLKNKDFNGALEILNHAHSVFSFANENAAFREGMEFAHADKNAAFKEGIKWAQKERAQKASDARHAENRAMKKMVFEWYGKNKGSFQSKDKAAEKATKLVPVGFRTARKWIDEYEKKHPLC